MRHFFHLFLHELRMQLISPASYVAATIFLLLMIFVYITALSDASETIQTTLLSEQFYQIFWLPVLFVVPLLTMRCIAEERRLGTLETLMTTPASAFEIVLSKFLGSYTFYIILWALTLSFPFFTQSVVPSNDLMHYIADPRALLGSFVFIAVSGTLYIAIGLFASCLTRSQLVAGMLSFCFLFFLIVASVLIIKLPIMESSVFASMEESIDYIRSFKHLEDFSRGIIDTRPFFLYFSTAFLFLGITTLVVEAKV